MDLLIGFAVFAAVTAAAYAIIQARTDARLATQFRLERVAGRLAADWALPNSGMLRGSRLSNIAWVERLLQQFDLARSIDLMLIRADWSLRVSEFIGIVGVAGAIGFLLGMLFTGLWPVALAFGFIAGYIPVFILKRAVGKRRQLLEKQLVEALVMISNALKAGFGLLQALDQAARQLDEPISKELGQTLRDTQVGSSVEEAIQGLGVRAGSYDLEIVVTAILVQRNVGGNLAEILDGVAHTMRERERIRGEIATLTAQQRLTGFIIAGLPVALGGLFYALNPDYMTPLFTSTIGRFMIIGAIVLEIVGAFIIKKIVSIDV
jgi:tight adherence protein B